MWIPGAILLSKQIFLNVISNFESVRSEFLNSCFYSILFSTGDGQEAKKRFCVADRIDHMPPALWRLLSAFAGDLLLELAASADSLCRRFLYYRGAARQRSPERRPDPGVSLSGGADEAC